MIFLKQSTTVVVQFGPFIESNAHGAALEVGLATAMDDGTTGIRLSKNGAALADRNDSTVPAYDAMGLYRITLDATDTDTLGVLIMIFEEATTTRPVLAEFMITPVNVWDSLFGADALEVDVTLVGGGAEDLPTATALATAQSDLDTLTGSDGATLATAQSNYAPAKAGDAMTAADVDTTGGAIDSVTNVINPVRVRSGNIAEYVIPG